MKRVFNFSAGPAVLPEDVLKQAALEMLDYQGSGMSVMEMSHRGKEFTAIIEQAESDVRSLLNVPVNYKVLFLQGGASLQFSAVPLNLMKNKKADYVHTGEWSKKLLLKQKSLDKSILWQVQKIGIFPIFPNLILIPLLRVLITFI